MKVCILNGNPDAAGSALDSYIMQLGSVAKAHGHKVIVLQLRDMDIRYCTGCFGCWVKTPGECIARDDSAEVARAITHADLLLCASPVKMGHISALLKKTHDKFIQNILPYFKVREREVHHPLRYERTPDLAVLLDRNGADDEDIAIIERSYQRLALNFNSRLKFVRLIDSPVEEVVDALAAS